MTGGRGHAWRGVAMAGCPWAEGVLRGSFACLWLVSPHTSRCAPLLMWAAILEGPHCPSSPCMFETHASLQRQQHPGAWACHFLRTSSPSGARPAELTAAVKVPCPRSAVTSSPALPAWPHPVAPEPLLYSRQRTIWRQRRLLSWKCGPECLGHCPPGGG